MWLRDKQQKPRRIAKLGLASFQQRGQRLRSTRALLGRNHNRHWCRVRHCQIYSALRAWMGSTVAARSAGTIAARIVTITRVPATPTSVEGS